MMLPFSTCSCWLIMTPNFVTFFLFHSFVPFMLLACIDPGEDPKKFCEGLAYQLTKTSEIPVVCQKYPDVVKELKRTIDEKDAAIATKGMSGGSGAEARRALASGTLYQAQVTRRDTQTRRFSKKEEKKGMFGGFF